MNFNTLLLLVMIWLLWSIHQDLIEANDRQRSVKALLQALSERLTAAEPAKRTRKSAPKTEPKDSAE